ncbi:MAG: SMR family transporter [Micrococcus sp.]|nr:SMR family transporter [Micrococcus sp.]
MHWFLLSLAIVAEVSATLSLRMATKGSRAWYLPVVAGYTLAFTLLAAVLALGMPLGVAYGIWSAAGVAITAVLGAALFKERFTWVMALGIALIIGGILLVEAAAR